jgi:histone acetyltransferase (RNA polymerase elongator complex component)
MKIFKCYEILNFLEIFKKFQFSLIDDEVRVFRINIKLLSNLVAELKIRENDSHCRSIVLKTMDRSIVKQLEKEKNSNFNERSIVFKTMDRQCESFSLIFSSATRLDNSFIFIRNTRTSSSINEN